MHRNIRLFLEVGLISLGLVLLSVTASAQTDWIAWKSRGSDLSNYTQVFESAYANDAPSGNFGLSPEQTALRRLALDSVRFLTDTSAVLYTSPKKPIASSNGNASKAVQADTIIHPRPTKRKQAAQELQQYLQQQYPFQPASDSIPFLGFPSKSKRKQAAVLPVVPSSGGHPPMGHSLVWTWLTVLALSIGTYWVFGKLRYPTSTSYGG